MLRDISAEITQFLLTYQPLSCSTLEAARKFGPQPWPTSFVAILVDSSSQKVFELRGDKVNSYLEDTLPNCVWLLPHSFI